MIAYKKLVTIGTVLTVLFLSPANVHAAAVTQTGAPATGDFVMEPGKIEVFVNPGETITKNVAITSRIDSKTNFKVTVEDFIGSQNPDTPVLLLGNDKSPYSFKDNINPGISDFTLGLGEKVEIPVTISVPKDAQPGGYYSSVIVASVPSDAPSTSAPSTRVISRLGVLFFIRVNGPVTQSGSLQDFKAIGPQPGLIQSGPIKFDTLFKNDGSIYLVPYGTVTIKNLLGKVVGQLPVDAYFALPNSLRYREVVWDQTALFGRYTATVELHRGYGDTVDTKTISFWVIPWKYVVIAIILLLLIITCIYFFTRKFELKRK